MRIIMADYELIAPCHFGMEAVLKREIQKLGYDILKVEDGKVTFAGDEAAIVRANIFLRTTERILIKIGSFKATTFDELFEGTKALPWEQFIPEDGASFPLRVTIMKDVVTVGLDTSGDSLHKRGYRQATVKAPITETLAAALIMLTPWKWDRILVDPFCGSGTFPIEAAMIGANIAPGMNRSFSAEDWTHLIPKKAWYDAANEAEDQIRRDIEMDIQGYDIDPGAIKAAMENARLAEVDHLIHFQQRPVSQLSHRKKYGFVITNPPYGKRLEEEEDMPALYREIGEAFSHLDSWSFYLITAFDQAERYLGRKADKNRKIYNGMMKTYFYQYMGPKPPRRNKKETTNK